MFHCSSKELEQDGRTMSDHDDDDNDDDDKWSDGAVFISESLLTAPRRWMRTLTFEARTSRRRRRDFRDPSSSGTTGCRRADIARGNGRTTVSRVAAAAEVAAATGSIYTGRRVTATTEIIQHPAERRRRCRPRRTSWPTAGDDLEVPCRPHNNGRLLAAPTTWSTR